MPVIYAGNVQNQARIQKLFADAPAELYVVENVYPRLDDLNIEPARRVIHDVFEKHIIHAPGMEQVRTMVNGTIIPPPGAVMECARLLYEQVGDLVVLDDCHALLFCDADIAPYICAELTRVGKDGIKVEKLALSTPFTLPQRFVSVTDTVASARFDCIAAALCGLSREKAQMLIRAGECTVDYEPCDRCDKIIEPPSVLSLRGYGKFRVDDVSMQTKKGRLRLYASKYI